MDFFFFFFGLVPFAPDDDAAVRAWKSGRRGADSAGREAAERHLGRAGDRSIEAIGMQNATEMSVEWLMFEKFKLAWTRILCELFSANESTRELEALTTISEG